MNSMKNFSLSGIVIMNFHRGRTNRDDDLLVAQIELLAEGGVRLEFRCVDIFLNAAMFSDAFFRLGVKVFAQQNFGNDFSTRSHVRRRLGMFIIHDHHGRDAEEIADDDLRAPWFNPMIGRSRAIAGCARRRPTS
ncbi:hypothetical protein CP49_22040 [Bradyrhizobium valentinum]|uniref:Uncharacterized protein n=1 Tax=Bradyrhizobium valentinum TaxID=1518501 RepID=A0A0R3LSL1_9BRAD|nr:hypothetical protein CP49_22040 [Bradyrhizobium valentinum]